jgi:serine/threonine protein kinase
MTLKMSSFPAGAEARDVQEDEATLSLVTYPTFGRYEVVGKLGGGGMGALYLARQKGPGGFSREVVLKVMLPDLAQRVPSAARMFLEEMRVLASINHNNVVRILDFGDEQQTLYMAMEYLPGVTLLSLRSHVFNGGHAFPPDLVASLLAQACRGLHAAHELRDERGNPRGLVHRDVSPQNIMCSPEGAVKVIDFGIVWARDRLVESTSSPQLKGKLAYMSPEQVGTSPLTRTSDLFSVGVILHELLSGRPLFRRDTNVATIMAVVEASVPSLRALRDDVPPRLDELVRKTLARDPALRPQTGTALADELDELVREAGGRFTRPEAAARYLESIGVSLMEQHPGPLTETPWFAHARGNAASPPSSRTERRVEAPPSPGVLQIAAPPAGTCDERTLPDGRRIVLQSLSLDEHCCSPAPLVFAAATALLPTPLLVTPRSTALFIDVDRRAVLSGGQRPSIYHHAGDPSTRLEGFYVPEVTRNACFDVGHRRAQVQRIRCDSGAASAGSRRLRVDLTPLPVSIVTDEGAKRLAVLSTVDPADEALHLACVSIF